jgi:hypothetical protein
MSLPLCPAFGYAAFDVGPRFRVMVGLRQDDAVESRVEASIASSIQAMTDQAGGRSLERGDAGIRGQLCVRLKALTWPQNASEGTRSQQVDAAQSRQGEKLALASCLIRSSSSSACARASWRRLASRRTAAARSCWRGRESGASYVCSAFRPALLLRAGMCSS